MQEEIQPRLNTNSNLVNNQKPLWPAKFLLMSVTQTNQSRPAFTSFLRLDCIKRTVVENDSIYDRLSGVTQCVIAELDEEEALALQIKKHHWHCGSGRLYRKGHLWLGKATDLAEEIQWQKWRAISRQGRRAAFSFDALRLSKPTEAFISLHIPTFWQFKNSLCNWLFVTSNNIGSLQKGSSWMRLKLGNKRPTPLMKWKLLGNNDMDPAFPQVLAYSVFLLRLRKQNLSNGLQPFISSRRNLQITGDLRHFPSTLESAWVFSKTVLVCTYNQIPMMPDILKIAIYNTGQALRLQRPLDSKKNCFRKQWEPAWATEEYAGSHIVNSCWWQ